MIAAPTLAPLAAADLLIEHVNVIPMTADSGVLPDSTVWIWNDRIESIAPTAQATVPPTVTRIDARGQWLMPALADMHVGARIRDPPAGTMVGYG